MSSPLVFALHAVAHEWSPGLLPEMVVLADGLAAEVSELQAAGHRIITAAELADELAAGGDGDGAVVLTFDDGWADALTVAAPLLNGLGVRGTFYLCPGLFGNEDPTMSPEGRILTREEAVALHEAGMELGAHSMHHPDLCKIGEDELRWELETSKAEVEAITGEPCRTFAYPFGEHGAGVRAATEAAGFELAFAFAPGPWERFAAPRVPKPDA
jgi:Predicted xylanase/chitin deacetylase